MRFQIQHTSSNWQITNLLEIISFYFATLLLVQFFVFWLKVSDCPNISHTITEQEDGMKGKKNEPFPRRVTMNNMPSKWAILSMLKSVTKQNVEHKINWTWEAMTLLENPYMDIC